MWYLEEGVRLTEMEKSRQASRGGGPAGRGSGEAARGWGAGGEKGRVLVGFRMQAPGGCLGTSLDKYRLSLYSPDQGLCSLSAVGLWCQTSVAPTSSFHVSSGCSLPSLLSWLLPTVPGGTASGGAFTWTLRVRLPPPCPLPGCRILPRGTLN